jgi:hypothetical protein
VTVDADVEEEAPVKASRPVKKTSKKQQAKSLQEQVDSKGEEEAKPVKPNGHSAKDAPRRTRSTRKTTQSG